MTRPTFALAALAVLCAATSAAQRVNPARLEARETPKPDTTLTLRAGDRDLVAELRVPSGKGPHPLAIVISLAAWLPLGVPQATGRGGLDWRIATLGPEAGTMPSYAMRAHAAGDSTWVVMSDSTSHFTMLDPQQPAFAVFLRAMQDALSALTPGR